MALSNKSLSWLVAMLGSASVIAGAWWWHTIMSEWKLVSGLCAEGRCSKTSLFVSLYLLDAVLAAVLVVLGFVTVLAFVFSAASEESSETTV